MRSPAGALVMAQDDGFRRFRDGPDADGAVLVCRGDAFSVGQEGDAEDDAALARQDRRLAKVLAVG